METKTDKFLNAVFDAFGDRGLRFKSNKTDKSGNHVIELEAASSVIPEIYSFIKKMKLPKLISFESGKRLFDPFKRPKNLTKEQNERFYWYNPDEEIFGGEKFRRIKIVLKQ